MSAFRGRGARRCAGDGPVQHIRWQGRVDSWSHDSSNLLKSEKAVCVHAAGTDRLRSLIEIAASGWLTIVGRSLTFPTSVCQSRLVRLGVIRSDGCDSNQWEADDAAVAWFPTAALRWLDTP